MKILPLDLDGLFLIEPTRHGDVRGWFMESYRKDKLEAVLGRPIDFVQANRSKSATIHTLRGLHYQAPPKAQAKLVSCPIGAVTDIVVDVRKSSGTYGEWRAVELSEHNAHQLFVPEGFLHGFITRQPDSELAYMVTDYYDPDLDGAVSWDSLNIDWGLNGDPVLSDKDRKAPSFAEWISPFD